MGFGRKLGFPTANIKTDNRLITPSGVFAVKARIGDNIYNAVCNIGFRPSVKAAKGKTVEAHLLNFKGNIYGKKIMLDFLGKIRQEKKFQTLPVLKKAISVDISKAKNTYFKEGNVAEILTFK